VNKKVAFLTTVFPMNTRYLYDFFNSLNKQTYTKFDVIVVNDGYVGFKELTEKFNALNIIELQCSDSPAKNREFGINYVKNNNYDVLIFGDSDDYFDENRVQVSVELLTNIDIIVNDLTLFDDQQGPFLQKYISNRIHDGMEVKLDFIKDKNIFGLSNTAINVTILGEFSFDRDLIAVDWYLYSILLLHNRKALFTNKTITYYRQYENNTVGIGLRTIESILKTIWIKENHYRLLKREDDCYISLYEDNCKLKKKIEDDPRLKELSDDVENPLWWENMKFNEEGSSI